jgi:hypothetical protein
MRPYEVMSGILVMVGVACTPSPPTLEKVPCHPASGKLSIGGRIPKGATILFVPVNEPADSKIPRPRATIGENGTFSLSTFGKEDGAPPGEYGIIVFWPGNEMDDQLQGRYSSPEKTAKKLTIVAGKNDLPEIKLY